ncbi:MAG: hypothetical protein J3K34DRAFT_391283 [Monoraphidium minutum]|nr:MAG: hypothetical protein J3K34DRAFT_391283 [Monoraphidium minutum]
MAAWFASPPKKPGEAAGGGAPADAPGGAPPVELAPPLARAGAGRSAADADEIDDFSADSVAVRQLRQQLAKALRENEQLHRDVAALCEQRAGSMFSAGYLLSEQAASLKQDVAQLRQQLRAVTAERDGLLEDMSGMRRACMGDSKHQSDKACRDAQTRAGELEEQLSYFQASASRAITDRDAARAALQQLTEEHAQLKVELEGARDRAREAQDAAAATRRAASEAVAKAEASAADARCALAAGREQATKARAVATALQKQFNQAAAREGELETKIEQLTAALVAAQAGVKELQGQATHAWRPAQGRPSPRAPAVPAEAGGPPPPPLERDQQV